MSVEPEEQPASVVRPGAWAVAESGGHVGAMR